MAVIEVASVANGDPLFASTVNQLQTNLTQKISMEDYFYGASTQYSTSSASYVDIDATNMLVNFTSQGNDILVAFTCSINRSTNGTVGAIAIVVDDVVVYDWIIESAIASYRTNWSGYFVLEDYAAATYEIKMQFLKSSGGILYTDIPSLVVMEL